MTTADLLTYYETCDLKGLWSRSWERRRLDAQTMLRKGVIAGLTETQKLAYGTVAGEKVLELAVDPGMEMPASRYLHESVMHHVALADLITSAIRGPLHNPWGFPSPERAAVPGWASSAFLDPATGNLRQIVLASSWSDARHYAEMRSWRTLGEVAVFDLSMKIAVVVLGQQRDGRRSGPWGKGFLHPQNHGLRFRKKSKSTSEVFSDKWEQVWREERDEISNAKWLQAMLDDDILRDVLFTVDLPVPGNVERARLVDMAKRKLDRLSKLEEKPESSLSVCDRPLCPFRGCCHSEEPHEPSARSGFVRIADSLKDDGKSDGSSDGKPKQIRVNRAKGECPQTQ